MTKPINLRECFFYTSETGKHMFVSMRFGGVIYATYSNYMDDRLTPEQIKQIGMIHAILKGDTVS